MLKKLYYKLRLQNKLRNTNFQNLVDILNDYDKFKNESDLVTNVFDGPSEPICLRGAGNVYDIFYRNLHLHLEDTRKQNIISLSLKSQGAYWRLDELSPEENKNLMEIYLWYDIEVLGKHRCSNVNFNDGTWNEYVYKTFCELEETIHGFTTASRFNKAYGKQEKENVSLEA